MKEVKFRAWDAIEGKMVPWSYFRDEHHMEDLFSKELTLIQFSGLRDKYADELYDGDIVYYNGQHFKLEWSVIGARYIFVEISGRNGTRLTTGNSYRAKLVGNIYETPELLK